MPSRRGLPFVIYGPGRDAGLAADISTACAAAAKGEAYTAGLSGSMSLVYIEDVARAYVQALLQDMKGAHVANLTVHQRTVEQAAKLIREIVPCAPIRISGAPSPAPQARRTTGRPAGSTCRPNTTCVRAWKGPSHSSKTTDAQQPSDVKPVRPIPDQPFLQRP